VEYFGVAAANSFDTSNSNRAVSANYSSNSVMTSQSNELLLGVHHVYSGAAVFTPATPWNSIATTTDGIYHEMEMQDLVEAGAGAFASTGALTASLDTQSVIVAFRGVSAGAAPTIAMSAPTNGATVSGSAVAISATATSSAGIAS